MKFLLPTLFVLLFSLAAPAQNSCPNLDSVLQATLNEQRSALNVKGLSAAIQFSDSTIWAGASGISSALKPVSTDMVFGIGSISKTVTAACILQMADEGLLGLDDSLHTWLDTFQYINPNITIRQLLRHQSGIYDVVTAPDIQDVLWQNQDSIWVLADVITTFIGPPTSSPGTQFRYSSTNYLLLGMIAEEVGDQAYFDSFRERFLNPLGLNSFAMAPFETSPNMVAHVWLDLNGDGTMDDAHNLISNWHSFDAATGPAGSYYATASDLARWIRAFAGGSLHSAGMMVQAKTTVSTPFQGGTKYGLGLMQRNFLGHTGFGHGGDSGYCGSAWYFPDLDISIVVLNNDGSKNSWQIASVVQALLQDYLDCAAALAAPVLLVDQDAVSVSPNPFLENLTVSLDLSAAHRGQLDLRLSNLLGKTMATQAFENQSMGEQQVTFSGLDSLPPGVYFLSVLENGRAATTVKLMKRG